MKDSIQEIKILAPPTGGTYTISETWSMDLDGFLHLRLSPDPLCYLWSVTMRKWDGFHVLGAVKTRFMLPKEQRCRLYRLMIDERWGVEGMAEFNTVDQLESFLAGVGHDDACARCQSIEI